jgi:hypothetical protein
VHGHQATDSTAGVRENDRPRILPAPNINQQQPRRERTEPDHQLTSRVKRETKPARARMAGVSRWMTMGSWGELSAGPFTFLFFKDVVPDDLICLFQDRMYFASMGRASTRYALSGKPDHDVEFFQYKATGRLIADRLDILGFDLGSALKVLKHSIDENLDSPPWFEGMGKVAPESVERWEAERAALTDLDLVISRIL